MRKTTKDPSHKMHELRSGQASGKNKMWQEPGQGAQSLSEPGFALEQADILESIPGCSV